VYAQASSQNPDFQGPDEATLLIRFSDGSLATNYLSLNTSPAKEEALIVGPKGSVRFKHGDTSEGLVGNAAIELAIGDRIVINGSTKGYNITLEEKDFIEAIRGGAEPLVKPEELIWQMKIIDAAKQCAVTGHAVEL
jgi:predicted dehydrogenase